MSTKTGVPVQCREAISQPYSHLVCLRMKIEESGAEVFSISGSIRELAGLIGIQQSRDQYGDV
jgi:hypothetical protein